MGISDSPFFPESQGFINKMEDISDYIWQDFPSKPLSPKPDLQDAV